MKKRVFLLLISLSYCSKDAPDIHKDTLAAINSRTISAGDFATQGQSIMNAPGINLEIKDGRINVLKDMINEELVFQDAVKQGYHLENLHVKHEIVKEYLKEKFGKNLPQVSNKQIEDFYEKNRPSIELIRPSHILIMPKDKNKQSIQEAKTLANRVHEQIVSKQISFTEAVKKYSKDTGTIEQNGDLGFFPWVKMVPKFSTAAFALKKIGDISPVVETDFGFHIIQLTEDQRGIDNYRDKIRWKLYQDNIQPIIDEYFEELRAKAKIQIFTDKLMQVNVSAQ